MSVQGKKVLVVGGAGYLGSVLVKHLSCAGFTVDVLDNFLYWKKRRDYFRELNVKLIEGDIRSRKTLEEVFKNEYDIVIHLAAIVGAQACDFDPQETKKINIEATKSLLDLSIDSGVTGFIFASTCSVYGAQRGKKITESSPVKPLSLYAETKVESEKYILSKMDEIKPVIFRMGTLYGPSPRMRYDLVINLFVAKAVSGEPLTVYGGSQYRPFLHVEDAARMYVEFSKRLLTRDKDSDLGIFNLVGENKTILEVAEIIKERLSDRGDIGIIVREDLQDKRDYFVVSERIPEFHERTIAGSVQEIVRRLEMVDKDYKKPIFSNFKAIYEDEEVRKKVYLKEELF